MVKRATVADVAKAAGVSVATVDRVLNNRLPVRGDTARKVHAAAQELDFHAAALIGRRLEEERPEVRLGFLLEQPVQAFYRDLTDALADAAATLPGVRSRAVVDHWLEQDPDDIARRLRLLADRCQAVALVSPEHPIITAAIEEVKARGVPVFALLSDCGSGVRNAYIGVDNRKVGRTAAWMLSKCAAGPGKIAFFVGSHRFHGHEMREIGLRAFFRERAPQFTVLDTIVNFESPERTREILLELVAAHDDLVGCYVGGGGSEGAIQAIRETDPARRPALVCNEFTPATRAALAEQLCVMTVATPVSRLAVETAAAMAVALRSDGAAGAGQTFLPFDVHLPETI